MIKQKIVYSIECFEKRGNKLIKTIPLPERKRTNYRKIFSIWNKEQILDGIKINSKFKVRLIARFKISLNISKYDYFFSECKV